MKRFLLPKTCYPSAAREDGRLQRITSDMACNRLIRLHFPILHLAGCLMMLAASACAGPEAPTVIPLPINPDVPDSITLGDNVGSATTANHANTRIAVANAVIAQ